jgi:uncharacterized repeat protein (TIGR03837 family)
MLMSKTLTWDIFCRVVDNYGDAGVCWRLARELAARHDARVRLWIDDLATLSRLVPAASAACDEQDLEGVRVCRWFGPLAIEPADIVIEAFGCGVPDAYAEAMAPRTRVPVWVVLEYLSAEAWVSGHHALPSPHPRLALERHFFFPGFTKGTGGLLREAQLFDRRDRFDDEDRRHFWRSLGHAPLPAGTVSVSLFAYESAPLPDLLRCWEEGSVLTVAAVPEGRVLNQVLKHFDLPQLPEGRVARRGALEIRAVPFIPQVRYDKLLWSCDINFVRGEDSFVRAQWAARPFVWHVYPQADEAHSAKLEAFLALYSAELPEASRLAVTNLMRVWNRLEVPAVTAASAWTAYTAQATQLRLHGARWADRIAANGDLAGNLARFCLSKLK